VLSLAPNCLDFLAVNSQLSTLDSKLPFSFRLFDHGFFAHDDHDAAFGDVVALAIGFKVIADFSALRNRDVAVDDGVADACMTPHIDMIE